MKLELWNPIYIEYAASNGLTPRQQLEADDGRMANFILWASQRYRELQKKGGAN